MKSKEKRKHKRWRWLRVTLEIAFMTAGILCSIMPYPYPLLVPIGIGTIRIISSAVAREKKAEEPPTIVYCNGDKEPHKKKTTSVTVVRPKPTKTKTAAALDGDVKVKNKKKEKDE